MSDLPDQIDPLVPVSDIDPAASAPDAPTEAAAPEAEAAVEATAPVEIPENWASLHWKQVVALAKQIGAVTEVSFDDAKRVIADELALRAAPTDNDGLVEMTKNGDTLRINPATVEAHKKAGWTLV